MDGRMYGWMGGRVDGWMDGRVRTATPCIHICMRRPHTYSLSRNVSAITPFIFDSSIPSYTPPPALPQINHLHT
jgi:hypothetical protein